MPSKLLPRQPTFFPAAAAPHSLELGVLRLSTFYQLFRISNPAHLQQILDFFTQRVIFFKPIQILQAEFGITNRLFLRQLLVSAEFSYLLQIPVALADAVSFLMDSTHAKGNPDSKLFPDIVPCFLAVLL